ncbi:MULTISPECIES: helix-turn-helix domain-containing protein [Clostridiaceae]|uniref:Helix-turn-helix transcriptional regulator n=1 Tax=Clostridium facile TaxID=2763035 RepID=A0ABR7IPK5_9CLOT|nr:MULTISPECIES: helix-turn-helix transcriptional regulator [Clostridiaceae]MBC5787070.1 helix-turn-helix transcriptional regulator [Clostridium facile]
MKLDYHVIGQRIRLKRRELNLTQMKLSELIDVSETYMSEIERGKSKVSLQVISNIARVLHTSLDYLVFGIPEEELKMDMDSLYQDILNLSPEENRSLKAFLTALKQK